jgi:L-aminopeptidase/D-esterase-like protein
LKTILNKAFLTVISCIFFCQNLLAEEVLKFDFPEVQICTAVNQKGPTGLTLVYFPKGAQAAVDIRGGSVGTFFTQEKMQEGEALVDGIALCGGGILGLEAVSGVISGLFLKEKEPKFTKMPLVSGAVIFDYSPRQNRIYPDLMLGRKALENVKTGVFPQGRQGAGVSASVGKFFDLGKSHMLSGQGGAFAQVGDTKIAVFTVVNAVGVILNDKGEIVYGLKEPMDKATLLKKVNANITARENKGVAFQGSNTTLTVMVINQKLSPRHLKQLGKQVHHAMSSVIYPYACLLDGDVFYTVSTNSIESDFYKPGEQIQVDLQPELMQLGIVAGEVAKQAVWAAVGYKG